MTEKPAFGFPLRWLAEAGSTNDVAREWALGGAPAGAVVTAARQTRGRGRRERKWDSPPDAGLYASFILRPGWLAKKASNLAVLGGMAAYHALERAGLPALRVKWPNDILAGGRKICGVLVEPSIGAGRIDFAVVGIGINVSHQAEDFPPDLRDRATSCRLEGVTLAVGEMLALLTGAFEEVLQAPFDAVCSRWAAAGAGEKEPEIE